MESLLHDTHLRRKRFLLQFSHQKITASSSEKGSQMSTKSLALTMAEKTHVLRGFRIILDRDIADLYGTDTKNLNKAIRRKKSLFTPDLMWQLTQEEMVQIRKRFPNIKSTKGG